MLPADKAQLPRKVRLSGPDCFHLVLDQHAKKHEAGGNVMRQVFYFNHSVDARKITQILKSSPLIYWLCNIKLIAGPLFTIPYWEYIDKGNEINICLHNHSEENEIPATILEQDISIEASRFIAADIIYYPSEGSALVLSWNHILLDGKGTALLFNHLNELSEGNNISTIAFFPAKEKRTNIIRYIRNMYEVKRFIKASSKSPICSVAHKEIEKKSSIVFKRIHFNEEETTRLETNAFKSGARFGANLFHIACCLHAVNAVNKKRKNAGVMWLPVPYDGRVRGTAGPIISNHVSYLFYRITQASLGSIPQTVECIGNQMKEQIKAGMAKKYDMLLRMMRHIPLWLYYFLISRTGEGVISSFLYSTTADSFNTLKSFLGETVRDVAIFPAATIPPGLTFIFLKHACTLNINIAYSPDVLKEDEWALIEVQLKKMLVADDRKQLSY